VTDTRVFPQYARLGEEVGRTVFEAFLSVTPTDAGPHSTLDGHVGKADMASLVGAAESAP